MDHLKFAAQCLDDSIDEQHKKKTVAAGKVIFTPDQLVQHAQAAALIAIAERMRPQFVQVGPVVFSPSDIATIDDEGEGVSIRFHSRHTRYLSGKELAAFLNWWNEYVDVVRLEVGE